MFVKRVITWIVRGISILIILLILGGVISFAASYFSRPAVAPSIDNAPWSIQTYSVDEMRVPSRIYYAESVGQDGQTPVITNYWTYNGKKYYYHRGNKEFPVSEYGAIQIVKRTP